ncbi:MAG: hypothetical protein U9N87_08175 [Planctomycetota bacterium]|nr:hypothetical protein [Planctomycetota bacterium]
MSKHVLVVSHSFPPLNNIAARRFGFLVPHLARHGWTPWVLTTESSGPLPVGMPERQVIRIGRHPQSTARVEGHAAQRSGRMSRPLRTLRTLLAMTRMQFRAVDHTCWNWRREVIARSDEVRDRLPGINAVLGTFGPAASLWIARHFSRRLDVPWVADYRDLAALRHDGRAWAARYLDRWIEGGLLGDASAVTSTGRTWAEMLGRAYAKPFEVIYNGWDPEVFTAGETRDEQEMPDEEPYLLYAGRFYPERMRAAGVVLEALAAEPGLELRVRSLGPSNLEESFAGEALRLGVKNRVRVMPPCSPREVAAEADHAVANLVLDDVVETYESSRGVLTGKFLELVAGERPVLAVTQPDSEMGPILESTQKGRICSTASEVRGFLREVHDGQTATEADAEEIARYSKASQAAVLAGLLNRIVDNPLKKSDLGVGGRVP